MLQTVDCEDRISALPEDLLVRILDLVPTKDAVATMFLSKRWLSVWLMTQRLEYKDSEEEDVDSDDDTDDDDDEKVEVDSKTSVWWFLEKSLQLHRAPVIDSLCIELGRMCPTDAHVGKWVANAVDRYVLYMRLKLLWPAHPISLPKSLYSCKSLMTLILTHKILVDVPFSASLPSLTTLGLFYVFYKDDDSLVRLLKSCPLLERLSVKRKIKGDNVTRFIVEMPNLLSLLYENYRDDDDGVGDTGRCLVIDTPALTYCRIIDTSGASCSMLTPRLDNAFIDIRSCPDDKFLSSISSVVSLLLCLTYETVVWCSTIKFSRLIECTIYQEESDWVKPTMLLLQNSPKLKSLTVNCKHTTKDLPLSWSQPSSVPECLSSQLEIIMWKEYRDREEEEQFLTYVLENSKCLKTAIISLGSNINEMVIEWLKEIPRVSTESQLIFNI